MNSESLSIWAELVAKGTSNAMKGLSQMIGQEIEVKSFGMRSIPVAEISQLVGGPEVMSAGIYLTISGAADGHLMLVLDPQIAYAFVDLLMGQPPNTTQALTEMESSALGEMGNIIGSFFLNTLADETGLVLQPSPPTVMIDYAGALMDIVAVDILIENDEAFVAETAFHVAGRDIEGMFFVMPSDGLLNALLASGSPA
ncbi:MAG: chemotaxis protein CheC [Chloroflexi bacterium]|nr:chemotaxis protein CheC [Chloroflexota bacterium]